LVVDNPGKKPIIGILGGIASGKSTVAGEFAKLGCKVIDADRIAHELLAKKPVMKKVAASFGDVILDSTGKIDHKKLADIVFADVDKLTVLNNIIHPLVLAHAVRLIERYSRQKRVKAVVLDMPLLVEVGWAERCDRLVFVDCRPKLRLDRARKMGIFDEKGLRIRENFQISLDRKADLADNIIDNNSGALELARQVAETFSCIVSNE